MAKKNASRFVCTNCGASYSAWAGRCSTCGEWNTLQEEAVLVTAKGTASKSGSNLQVSSMSDSVKKDDAKRIQSGISDVDLVLGGGLVKGSMTLIAGQPGIGKSTLLLQILQIAAGLSKTVNVLYVSGEESSHQVGLRASRLGVSDTSMQLATSTSADDIARTIASNKYDVVIVDSIQTVTVESVPSTAGSVTQITNCAHLLMNVAKEVNTAVILVGHVTKEGSIAGPKVLEHVVDTVLQLEGDRYGGFKILRSVKNRFGSTNEAGIFEMVEEGMKQVENPSAALLAERQITDGSVVLATMEGSRPMLVEVQALVNKTSYGYPKRAASGVELNRLNLLIAMLERRTKLQLSDQDIYINIVGGMKISDPGLDLAICMAIGSAAKGLQLKDKAVVFGEVGLSGEVRHVPFAEKRLKEAEKLGFEIAIGPRVKMAKNKKSILEPISDVRSALNTYLKI
jgi:DNA repair protein RadA/Sms